MLEIEENKKVKSTWAKALAQSDGDDKKADSLYINLRVTQIKEEANFILEKQREEIEKNKKEIEEKKLYIENLIKTKELTAIIEKIEDIEKYGYLFLSNTILRKNGTWDDYNLIYDENLNIYFVKDGSKILDSFYIEDK